MLSLKSVILVSFMLFPLGNLMPGKKFLVETEDSDEGESIGESSEILKLLYYLQLFKDRKRDQWSWDHHQWCAIWWGVTQVPSVGAAASAATLLSVMTRQRRNGSRFACARRRKPRNPVTIGTITPLSKVAVAAPEENEVLRTSRMLSAATHYL